jgi:hypothetical protein
MEPNTVSTINTTLRLNRLVGGVLETTGFKEHFDKTTKTLKEGKSPETIRNGSESNRSETASLQQTQNAALASSGVQAKGTSAASTWNPERLKPQVSDPIDLNSTLKTPLYEPQHIEPILSQSVERPFSAHRSQRVAAENGINSFDNLNTTVLNKGVELRFEEYDLSIQVMQKKLDSAVQDIDFSLKKILESRMEGF